MKIDELKLRINTQIGKMVDSIFPKGNLLSGMANATVKFYVEQNMYNIEDYIKPFADKNGQIDTNRFLNILEDQVFVDGNTSFDVGPYIKQYIPEGFQNWLPDKLIIDKEDVMSILREKKRF